MEYCAGGALHNLLHNETCPKRFSIIAPILQDAARGMQVGFARHSAPSHANPSHGDCSVMTLQSPRSVNDICWCAIP